MPDSIRQLCIRARVMGVGTRFASCSILAVVTARCLTEKHAFHCTIFQSRLLVALVAFKYSLYTG